MSAPASFTRWNRIDEVPIYREPRRLVLVVKKGRVAALDTGIASSEAAQGVTWWAEAPEFDEAGPTVDDITSVAAHALNTCGLRETAYDNDVSDAADRIFVPFEKMEYL